MTSQLTMIWNTSLHFDMIDDIDIYICIYFSFASTYLHS